MMLLRIACAGVLTVCLGGLALAIDPTKDSAETIKKNLAEKKALLIDVRDLDEWNDGHLKGAKLLPYSELAKKVDKDRINDLVKDKKTIVYMHCGAGRRALKAAEIFEQMGFDVRPLKQGYKDLVEQGFEKDEEAKKK